MLLLVRNNNFVPAFNEILLYLCDQRFMNKYATVSQNTKRYTLKLLGCGYIYQGNSQLSDLGTLYKIIITLVTSLGYP